MHEPLAFVLTMYDASWKRCRRLSLYLEKKAPGRTLKQVFRLPGNAYVQLQMIAGATGNRTSRTEPSGSGRGGCALECDQETSTSGGAPMKNTTPLRSRNSRRSTWTICRPFTTTRLETDRGYDGARSKSKGPARRQVDRRPPAAQQRA